MLRVLTDPAAFFEEESENPDLLTPALIVIATALLTVTSYVPMYNYIEQSLTGDAAQAFSFLYISALVGGFLGDIIVWVIATAIVYAITAVAFDGEGSFTNTLALFGWGFVPSVIAGAISTAGYYWIFSSRPPGSVSDPRQIQTYLQSLQNIPELQAITVLTILLLCWQGVLWAHALKHGRNIAFREAAIATAVPVATIVLLSLSSLL